MMNTNTIEVLLDAYQKAHADRDEVALGELYEEDAVICDLAPPLVRNGFGQSAIKEWFETWDGPVRMELRDEKTHRTHDLAVVATLVRVTGSKKGEEHDLWTRATFVLRNSENKWLIAHEHSSVPFHMDGSLRAAIDLAPPGDFYDRT